MRSRIINGFFYAMVLAILASHLFSSSINAQEKRKREKFGSSLSRLKWDEQKQSAIETKEEAKPKDETAAGEETIRLDTMMAVFDIMVVDAQGRAISGLTKDDFVVVEDSVAQQVAGLSPGDGSTIPRSIVLIIDYSGSQRPYIQNSVAAAKVLVDKLKPNDRMAVITDDVSLLVDFTNDKKKLFKGLDSLLKKVKSNETGRSEQYSALLATLREIIVGEQRPIIIFQTDGDELVRLRVKDKQTQQGEMLPLYQNLIKQYSLEDIYTAAQKTRTTIYAVIPNIKFIGVPPEKLIEVADMAHKKYLQALAEAQPTIYRAQQTQASDEYLYQLAQTQLRMQLALAGVAKLTGGWAEHLEQPEQAEGIYNRIFSGIERRYILSYYPTNSNRDGKLRKVEIKVRNHPEYTVWGKKSYYAENQ